jgi:hypothetical protein
MAYPADDEAYLLLLDQHIEELKRRLDILRERIVDMVAKGENTSNQSELFCALFNAIRSMKAVRAGTRTGMDMPVA